MLKYTLLRPPEDVEPPEAGWPLVVINPGSGGVGSSGGTSPRWSSPYYREHYPAYVLLFHPQERTMDYLTDAVFTLPAFNAQFDLLDHLLADPGYNIDPRRIYVGGFSMGGSTTWLMLLKRPHFFAAGFPISSRPIGRPEEAVRLAHQPIWMTTGHDDGGAGSSFYLRAYQLLQAAGAEKVRFWEVQFTGHSGAAERLYHLPEWLFQQQLPEGEAPVPAAEITRVDGLTLQFDASASSDPDGGALTHEWDFGDGQTASSALAEHTYAGPGSYMARLRVRDAANRTSDRYMAVIVTEDSLVINEPMRGGDFNIETPFNTPYAFSLADFESVASDPEGDPLVAVRIDTLPFKGILLLDDVELSEGDEVAADDLGSLIYLPSGNRGMDRFEYSVFDGYSWSPYGNDLHFTFPLTRGEIDSGLYDDLTWSGVRAATVGIFIGDPPPSALFANLWSASSATMETSSITVGAQYFVDDEGPVITELPDYLDGAENIRTTSTRTSTGGVQDNQQSGTGTWIRFEVTRDATIYVAYDGRNTAVPAWLDDWEFVSGDEVKSWIYYDLFKKEFSAGSIVELGTNRAPPGDGPNGYFVMGVGEGEPPGPPPAARPVLRVAREADGTLRLRWQGNPQSRYTVRGGKDFANVPEWIPVDNQAGEDGEMETVVEIPDGETQWFWIIETRPL